MLILTMRTAPRASRKLADGSYQLLTAEHVFRDYQFSKDGKVALPE